MLMELMQRSIVVVLLVSINVITYCSVCGIVLIWLLKGTRDRNRGKEADASFRPVKLAVTAPNGSDGNVISVLFIGFELFKASNFIYLFYLGSSLAKFGRGSSLHWNIRSRWRSFEILVESWSCPRLYYCKNRPSSPRSSTSPYESKLYLYIIFWRF